MNNRLAGLLLLAICLSGPVGAHAQMDMERAMRADSAMTRLLDAVVAGAEDGDYPRLSDPSVALLFSRAFDGAILAQNEPSVDDLPVLSALQKQAGAVARAYIAAGTDVAAGESPGDRLDMAARNFLEFLPEIAVVYDYSVLAGARIAGITAKLARQVAALGDEEPAVQRSIGAIATSQAKLLELVIGCSSDSSISGNWRRQRLVLLNRTSGEFAALFPKEMAQAIADRALAAAISEGDDAVATELKQFALAILR